jgi:hypothetical protein
MDNILTLNWIKATEHNMSVHDVYTSPIESCIVQTQKSDSVLHSDLFPLSSFVKGKLSMRINSDVWSRVD